MEAGRRGLGGAGTNRAWMSDDDGRSSLFPVLLGGAVIALSGAVMVRLLRSVAPQGALQVQRAVTVQRAAPELYALWLDPATPSAIMGDAVQVSTTDGRRLQWSARLPGGKDLQWQTQVTDDQPGRLLRWRSADDAPVQQTGEVQFRAAPGDRGTEVTLRMQFEPPGGVLGALGAKALHALPEQLTGAALRRFKNLAESGEIPRTAPNPAARGSGQGH